MERPDDAAPAVRETLRRRLVSVSVGVGIVVFTLATLEALKGQPPPELQPTLPHRAAVRSEQASVCLGCHAQGSELDRPPAHTGRQDCWVCHALAQDPDQ